MSSRTKSVIYYKTNGHCAYCGEWLDPFSSWTVDHVIPKASGGTDDIDNLVAACKPCNCAKKDMSDEEFKVYMNNRIIGHFKSAIELIDRFPRSNKSQIFTAIKEVEGLIRQHPIVFPKDDSSNPTAAVTEKKAI